MLTDSLAIREQDRSGDLFYRHITPKMPICFQLLLPNSYKTMMGQFNGKLKRNITDLSVMLSTRMVAGQGRNKEDALLRLVTDDNGIILMQPQSLYCAQEPVQNAMGRGM